MPRTAHLVKRQPKFSLSEIVSGSKYFVASNESNSQTTVYAGIDKYQTLEDSIDDFSEETTPDIR